MLFRSGIDSPLLLLCPPARYRESRFSFPPVCFLLNLFSGSCRIRLQSPPILSFRRKRSMRTKSFLPIKSMSSSVPAFTARIRTVVTSVLGAIILTCTATDDADIVPFPLPTKSLSQRHFLRSARLNRRLLRSVPRPPKQERR